MRVVQLEIIRNQKKFFDKIIPVSQVSLRPRNYSAIEFPVRIALNSLIFFIENYCCPVKKETIFILIFMLRLENSLLCKQNGITSQIVYYHFGAHFDTPSIAS